MSTHTPIRILHVDDEPGFSEMVAEFLEREDETLEITTATSASEGLQHLDATQFDCVVSDYDMPEQNGIQFLDAVRDDHPDLPFILFTGKGSEEIASEAISAGVTDYLQKEGGTGQYTLLAHRITNAVAQYRSEREIEASQERLSLFFDQSPLGAIEWTEEFDIARVNDTAADILGYDADELVGSSWTRLVPGAEHDDDDDDVADVFADLLTESTAYDVELETVTKDGERLVCEWHHRVVSDELGDVVTVFSKFQDVTARVQRQ
jgi:PAS domain S-box-containing protein